jgi:hypothetical protein
VTAQVNRFSVTLRAKPCVTILLIVIEDVSAASLYRRLREHPAESRNSEQQQQNCQWHGMLLPVRVGHARAEAKARCRASLPRYGRA